MPIDRKKHSREDINKKMDATSDELIFQDGNKNSMSKAEYIKAIKEENKIIENYDKLAKQESSTKTENNLTTTQIVENHNGNYSENSNLLYIGLGLIAVILLVVIIDNKTSKKEK